jgi:GNAT superfamily N-acetyltransferase
MSSTSPAGIATAPQVGGWSASLTTRSGLRLFVRPAAAEDRPLMSQFLSRLTAEDLRFRFLSAAVHPSSSLLDLLVDVDHVRTEDYLAFLSDRPRAEAVASAMLAMDSTGTHGEVAIAVRPDCKGRGVGWTLLAFVADEARRRGLKQLDSLECCDNRTVIGLEREMGFTAQSCPDDPTLVRLSKLP